MTVPGLDPVRRADTGPLDRALDRASGSRLIPGNAVALLTDGPDTFSAMLALIEGARRWIHFENYIIRSDETGERFAAQLIAAARRGASVRVLYDHFGSRTTSRRFWRRLREGGVEVRAYNRVNPFRPIRSLRRDHRKYVSADGSGAVVGGLCIGDEWAGRPERSRAPWRDTAMRIAGPAVSALEYSFGRLWREAGGQDIEREIPAKPEVAGDATARVVEGVPGRLRLYRAVELMVAAVQSRLWVTDAYLVAPTPLFRGLIAAARDGVDVRLLLPGRTDIPALRLLTRVGYRELLEAGVRIFEWYGPMLHAKTVLVDDRWFKVGSTNLNPSSLISNHELDLIVEDRRAVEEGVQRFRRDLRYASEIVLRPRRVPQSLAQRLPPAVVPAADATPPEHRRSVRELSQRAVVTVWHVAGGARRSLAGAALFVTLGAAALLVALPRVMAYILAAASFMLSIGAAVEFFRRRRIRRD